MIDKSTYKFTIQHEKAWAWHIGMFFCVEEKEIDGKRDIYLFLCFGRHDFSIGFLHIYDNEEEDDFEYKSK